MKNIIIILILISIGSVIGFWQYQHRKDVNFCKDACVYIPGGNTWKIGVEKGMPASRLFAEQEQCVDYCLRNK